MLQNLELVTIKRHSYNTVPTHPTTRDHRMDNPTDLAFMGTSYLLDDLVVGMEGKARDTEWPGEIRQRKPAISY